MSDTKSITIHSRSGGAAYLDSNDNKPEVKKRRVKKNVIRDKKKRNSG